MKEQKTKPEQAVAPPADADQKPSPASKEATRGPKPKKQDHNFSQSRDIREDRGIRQIKTTVRGQSSTRGR
jgi:hypothetical protein